MRKYGSGDGEIIEPENNDDKITTEATKGEWTDKDSRELAEEITQTPED